MDYIHISGYDNENFYCPTFSRQAHIIDFVMIFRVFFRTIIKCLAVMHGRSLKETLLGIYVELLKL